MVKSMTGYGRAVETVNGPGIHRGGAQCQQSVSGLHGEAAQRASFGEDAVKQAVKATISRGKVDVFVSVRSEGVQDTAVSLNKPMVEGYLAALKQLQADYGVTGEITVSMLAGLPDVFLLDKPQVDEAQLLADFLSVAEKALASFDAMRTTEGAALAEDLRSRGRPSYPWFPRWRRAAPRRWRTTGRVWKASLRRSWRIRPLTKAASSPRPPSLPTRWPWTRKPSACAAT